MVDIWNQGSHSKCRSRVSALTQSCHHCRCLAPLTHWGRATHICVGKLTIIGSINGLSPGRRQAIIGTNAGILLIGSVGININEIVIEIHSFSFRKMHLNMSSAKWRSFCLGLNVLKTLGPFKQLVITPARDRPLGNGHWGPAAEERI